MQGLRMCARLASRLPVRQQGRFLSSSSAATKPSIQVQQERDRQELNDFFPELMENVREILQPIKIQYETEWLVKALEYNGRFLRWPGILNTYNTMRVLSPENGPDHLRRAKLLAWAVEIAHIVFLVTDDISDDGNMRWGKPVWWKLPEVGLNCVNDALLMEGVMYQILKREFGDNPHYVQLFELFTHTMMVASLGQNYDGHIDARFFDEFSPKMYDDVVRSKTSEITFYFPAMAGLVVNGRATDYLTPRVAFDIAQDLGVILQTEDDFDDCYSAREEDPHLDIQNGRCSWMITEAKKRANEKQLAILKENYGKKSKSNADMVLNIYNDLRLKEVFLALNKTHYEQVQEKIDRNKDIVPSAIFNYSLDTLRHFSPVLRY